MSPTHAEGKRIAAAIRAELNAKQLLANEERLVTKLIQLNRTQADQSDPSTYEQGDVIVLNQNIPGHRKGERFTVGDAVDERLLKYANRFQVFRTMVLPLAVGDTVRFTANGRTAEGKHDLHNGSSYRVSGFTKDGYIKLSNNWIVSTDHGFLSQGYVVTSHASQGKTFNNVIIAESSESLAAASREQFYVLVSRGRKRAVNFTDDRSALRASVTSSASRVAATELVKYFPVLANPQQRAAMLAQNVIDREQQQPTRIPELTHDR